MKLSATTFQTILSLLAVAFGSCGIAEEPSLAESRQLILVVAPDWTSTRAELRCFERAGPGASWKPAGSAIQVVVGRNGLAWGIGLHGPQSSHDPIKREGDGRAPAGVFALHEVFAYASETEAKITQFPYRQLTAQTAGVDDPRSRFYNRLVDEVAGTKDWQSAERMLLPSGLYRWGIFVEHNWKQVPGAGSCIFLHIWEDPGRGTSGCTAMPADAMERLVRWLDRTKHPRLVQLPESEYQRLKQPWSLP